jgi:hypothetical protein
MWSSQWNENWQRNRKYSDKICHSATLCTTNPTWTDRGSNLGRRSGKPATNRLSYGTAFEYLCPLHLNYPRVNQHCDSFIFLELLSSWSILILLTLQQTNKLRSNFERTRDRRPEPDSCRVFYPAEVRRILFRRLWGQMRKWQSG